MGGNVITFDYINHRGVKQRRTVNMISLDFLPHGFKVLAGTNHPEFQYPPGWFLQAYDPTREEERTFSINPERMTILDVGGDINVPLRFPQGV